MPTEPKPKRVPKPPRVPLYAVGAVVTTKRTVRIPKRVLNRKWLYLLTGTEWTVTAVTHEPGSRKPPLYHLSTHGYTITRAEWRLKPLAGTGPPKRT
jgi:hypothetical protein